jgi:hypothetical protein
MRLKSLDGLENKRTSMKTGENMTDGEFFDSELQCVNLPPDDAEREAYCERVSIMICDGGVDEEAARHVAFDWYLMRKRTL